MTNKLTKIQCKFYACVSLWNQRGISTQWEANHGVLIFSDTRANPLLKISGDCLGSWIGALWINLTLKTDRKIYPEEGCLITDLKSMYNSYPMGCAIDIYLLHLHVKKMYFYCTMCLNVLIPLVLFSASCIKSIFNIATFRNWYSTLQMSVHLIAVIICNIFNITDKKYL